MDSLDVTPTKSVFYSVILLHLSEAFLRTSSVASVPAYFVLPYLSLISQFPDLYSENYEVELKEDK